MDSLQKNSSSKIKRIIFTGLLALFIGMLALISILLISVEINKQDIPEVEHYFESDGTVYSSNYKRMVKQEFPVVKGENTFRIFVLGGSQAMGTPYVHQDVSLKFNFLGLPEGGGISTWLYKYFTVLLPGKKVEVINAAVGGEDIKTVEEVHKEILQIGFPDLIIILSGNNEFFRHYKSESSYPNSSTEFQNKLKLLSIEYSQSLASIIELSNRQKVKTFVLTVPTNLRDWLPKSDGSFDEKKYMSMLTSENYQSIIDQLEGVTDQNALRYFYLGKAYDKLGQYREALKYYLLAKDYDYRFLRTHSNFNEIIRASFTSEFVRIIDMEILLKSYSQQGIPGFDLFHDWCHMRLEANELVAKEIAKFFKSQNQIDIELPDNTLPPDYKRKAQLLYFIKKLKWLRLDLFSDDDVLGEENIENVKEQY